MDPLLTDRMLLDRFLATREEAAFACLVGRYLDQVHAVARRVTANDELARDVAQATFIRLAERAARIPHELPLSSWLHRISRGLAVDAVRSESRRKKRELRAGSDSPTLTSLPPMGTHAPEPDWSALAPVVDELVERLPAADRDVLLLRYYRNESHAAIAARLGLTESTARMRASRALEKLRVLLGKRGIATSSAALSTLLPAHAAPAAPRLVVASVLQAAHGIAPLALSFLNSPFLAMTSAQKIALGGALLLMLAATGYTLSPDPTVTAVVTLTALPSPPPGKLDATRSRTPRPVPGTPEERLARLKEIAAIPDSNRRSAEMVEYLDGLPANLWGETDGIVASFGPQFGPNELLSLTLAGWTKIDPVAALDYEMAGKKFGSILGQNRDILLYWGERDLQAAMQWVMAQPAEEGGEMGLALRETLLVRALNGGFKNSPEDAIRLVSELPAQGPLKAHLLESLGALSAQSPGLETRLLEAATGPERAVIVGKIISRNLPLALELLERFPEASEYADFKAIYSYLAASDFPAASAGLASMEVGERQQQAATGMLEALIPQDLNKARSIMERYPEVVTDAHRHRFIEWAARGNPALALEQAAQLSDESEAGYVTALQLKTWLRTDPEAAGKWLHDHPQPASVTDRLEAP